jgi:hypothetical protein
MIFENRHSHFLPRPPKGAEALDFLNTLGMPGVLTSNLGASEQTNQLILCIQE